MDQPCCRDTARQVEHPVIWNWVLFGITVCKGIDGPLVVQRIWMFLKREMVSGWIEWDWLGLIFGGCNWDIRVLSRRAFCLICMKIIFLWWYSMVIWFVIDLKLCLISENSFKMMCSESVQIIFRISYGPILLHGHGSPGWTPCNLELVLFGITITRGLMGRGFECFVFKACNGIWLNWMGWYLVFRGCNWDIGVLSRSVFLSWYAWR